MSIFKAKSLNVVLFIIAVCCLVGIFCGKALSSRPYLEKYPYIVHIVIDGLCAEHLGCYGNERPSSPFIDSLSKESIIFKNAFCQRTETLPSMISMMSASYPLTNGIRFNGTRICVPVRCFPEVLGKKGYNVFYIDSPKQDKTLNHTFKNLFKRAQKAKTGAYLDHKKAIVKAKTDDADGYIETALEIIQKQEGEPFYLFFILNEVHDFWGYWGFIDNKFDEYTTLFMSKQEMISLKNVFFDRLNSAEMSDNRKQKLRTMYDARIRFVDDRIKKIVFALKELGIWDKTVLILHADHGENIFYHDRQLNNHTESTIRTLYDTTVRVPLIVRIPGYASKSINAQVELIDLVPTLMGILKIGWNTKINKLSDGQDFSRIFRRGNIAHDKQYVFSEGGSGVFSVRSKKWKYIGPLSEAQTGARDDSYQGEELYDLQNDPEEKNNIFNSKKEIANTLKEVLFEWCTINKKKGYSFEGSIPYNVEKFLEETGYKF